MCVDRKQIVNFFPLIAGMLTLFCVPAKAESGRNSDNSVEIEVFEGEFTTAGSISVGQPRGGIVDRVYVTAPPHWTYQIAKTPGSFVDCGNETEIHATDGNGRGTAKLTCGVTITETLVIPAAAESARLVIHY